MDFSKLIYNVDPIHNPRLKTLQLAPPRRIKTLKERRRSSQMACNEQCARSPALINGRRSRLRCNLCNRIRLLSFTSGAASRIFYFILLLVLLAWGISYSLFKDVLKQPMCARATMVHVFFLNWKRFSSGSFYMLQQMASALCECGE